MEAVLLTNPTTNTTSSAQECYGPCAVHVSGGLNGASIKALISSNNSTVPYVPYDFPFIGSLINGPGIYVINLPGTYYVKLEFTLNPHSQAVVPNSVSSVIYN